MNRITEKLSLLKKRDEKALVCFLTAGFPNIKDTVPLVLEIEKAGADIIELGMPFSEPLADGPIIQHSSQIALKNGITLDKIFDIVKAIRKKSEIPIVLMGYLNPILAYGAREFFKTASKSGVDGVVLPELPFEESSRFKSVIEKNGLVNILLVTPTTPSARIAEIDKASSGFLYCVSTTGVTGSRSQNYNQKYLSRVRKIAKNNPVLVGFGIKTPEDAKQTASQANGIIVGSALIKIIAQEKSHQRISMFVRRLKESI